ncbi:MAG: hypothetical protein ACRDQ7_22025 [Haloechinothrix sp.]
MRPDAPLWNEGRTIVGQELREPTVHFAVLEQLATGEKETGEIAAALRLPNGTVPSTSRAWSHYVSSAVVYRSTRGPVLEAGIGR